MSLVLASASPTRAQMLRAAGVPFTAEAAMVDEVTIREALAAEGATPRDIADALAEAKARKISARHPEALVLGSDQVLALEGKVIGKAQSLQEAEARLTALSGRSHHLHSAAVLYTNGQPLWRVVETATLTMHSLSPAYIADYLARNWPGVADSVGTYRIEEEGARLFASLSGDHFTILGLPLLPLLDHLVRLGALQR